MATDPMDREFYGTDKSIRPNTHSNWCDWWQCWYETDAHLKHRRRQLIQEGKTNV